MSNLTLAFELGKEWSALQHAMAREKHTLGFPMIAETDDEQTIRVVEQDTARAVIRAYEEAVAGIERAVRRGDLGGTL